MPGVPGLYTQMRNVGDEKMKKFGIDNPFFGFMGRLGDILILNILFVITCIPVVTIGTSLCAMYQVTLRMARKESNYVAGEYFRAWKAEWKQSTVIWLIMLAAGCLLVFDVIVGRDMWNLLNAAVGALLFVWGMLFTYVFAVQARFVNTVRNTFKNAMYMAVRHFPFAVLMLALNLLPVLCILLGTAAMAMATPIYVVVGFALTARINAVLLNRIFKKYIPKKERTENEEESVGEEKTDESFCES